MLLVLSRYCFGNERGLRGFCFRSTWCSTTRTPLSSACHTPTHDLRLADVAQSYDREHTCLAKTRRWSARRSGNPSPVITIHVLTFNPSIITFA